MSRTAHCAATFGGIACNLFIAHVDTEDLSFKDWHLIAISLEGLKMGDSRYFTFQDGSLYNLVRPAQGSNVYQSFSTEYRWQEFLPQREGLVEKSEVLPHIFTHLIHSFGLGAG